MISPMAVLVEVVKYWIRSVQYFLQNSHQKPLKGAWSPKVRQRIAGIFLSKQTHLPGLMGSIREST